MQKAKLRLKVQKAFEKYYARIHEEIVWSMVLPKYFKKGELKRTGFDWIVKCVFHEEATPSLRFSGMRQVYHCFGCGVGGNVFHFIRRYEGGLVPAMFFIRRHFGIELPFSKEEWKRIKNIIK